MDRRTYLLFTGVTAVLAAALLVTPIWDVWYYSHLRSSPGAYVPLAAVAGAPLESRGTYRTGAHLVPAAAAASRESRQSPATVPAPATASSLPIAPPPAPPRRKVAAPSDRAVEQGNSQRPATTAAPAHVPAESQPPLPSPPSQEVRTDDPAPGFDHIAGGPREEVPPAGHQPPSALFYATREASLPSSEVPAQPANEDRAGQESPSSRVQAPPSGNDDPEPGPAAPPLVRLLPGGQDLSPGEVVAVTVHVSDAVSMSSLPFHLSFDPAVLEFVDSQVGTALAGNHEAILLASVNPNRPGDLAVGLSLVESSGLFSGSGALVQLRFRALAQGESHLAFNRASFRGATSQPLEAQFEQTSITVR